ncbi:MAG: SGNH/GDSL hydrolase family protein [Brevundimonas sp.]|uniref:SGNH/GDSL hydrolase family protein n=1 Tax=Brevundimonas sp. TaxID=1871086 RepID=UPI002735D4F2|nr:SGNH/GDSL hydrolase family protein [Brevundimonas sp.]MDP3405036.1 SGNH/GDSL hydrolase family protein [Brevundimonas sp.]
MVELKAVEGKGVRTVLFGDSLTFLSNHIDTPSTTFAYDDATGTSYYEGGTFANTTDYGAFSYADALMLAPHYVIKNAGIGGNTTTQMLARLQEDVLQYEPELVYFWGGRNDFAQGAETATVIANATAILDALERVGAFVCVIDVPPSVALSAVEFAARKAIVYCEWLRDEVRKRRNCVLVSALGTMVDPDFNNDGVAKTNYVLNDNTHNNNLGALRVGEEIARVMTPLVKPWAYYPSSPVEGFDFQPNDTPEIRNSNPLFAGSSGTKGTGITGTVATGYEVTRLAGTPTAVCSVVEEVEHVGNAQRIAMTFGAADDAIYLGQTTSIHSRFVAGKVMEMQLDLIISADSETVLNRIEMYSGGTFNGGTKAVRGLSRVVGSNVQGVANNIQALPLAGKRMRIRTPRLYIPTGPSTLWQHFIRFYAAGAGTVTVDVSRYAVRLFTPA